MRRRLAVLLWLAAPGWALELSTDGFAVSFTETGRITDLRIARRPAPVFGEGGWDLLDVTSGADERYFFGLGEEWYEGNAFGLSGPMWRVGPGWTRLDETFNEAPVVSVTDPPEGFSDTLRFRVNTAGEAVYTIAVWVRTRSFTGRPQIGVLPINAVGQATGRLVALDWLGADRRDGEWFRVSAVLAPVPTTAFLELHLGLEQAAGTFDVGGAEVVYHLAGTRRPVTGRLEAVDGGATFRGETEGVALTARYQTVGSFILVDAEVTATDEEDHAFTLRFTLPVNGAGWLWWDTLRRSQVIPETGGHLLGNWLHLAGGRALSPYPLGCITRPAPAQGLAIAAPLSQPVITRYGFRQEQGLFAAFDLGLSPRLAKPSARLRLAVYAPDARWGMRAAVEQYYDLYESDVLRRSARAGAWFTALNPDVVRDPERLGLLFDEQAAAHLDWSRSHSMYSLTSIMPWGKFRGESSGQVAADGLYPIDRAGPDEPPERGLMHDADGRPVRWRLSDGTEYVPWCTDPDLLPDGPAAQLNALLATRLTAADGVPFDGLLVDGVGAEWAGWQTDNFRDEHLGQAAAPLSSSRAARRPVLTGATAHIEYLAALSRRLHDRGMLLLGSLDRSSPLPYVAPYLDVLGAGEQLPPEEHLMWLRVIAYHKPITFLDPTVLDPNVMRRQQQEVWQRALLWGAFPGSAGWLTSRNLALHEAFFAVYVPVLRDLAEAGWAPVPYATVSDAAIEVERYGFLDTLYLVLRNGSDTSRNFVLTLDPRALGLVTVGVGGMVERRLVFVDRLSRSKRAIELRVANDRWQTPLSIGARSVMVLTPYKVDFGFDTILGFDDLLEVPAP